MRRPAAADNRTRLIVNADDFGFFDEVSRGIVEAAEAGVVSATGVMANGPALDRWIGRLQAVPGLSIGVHLNATLGSPLTPGMSRLLESSRREFTPKGQLVAAMLRGRVPIDAVLAEWRAQIRRCLDSGIRLAFVNSHEHIHMFPGLYGKVVRLAAEFGISHVRAPSPEWSSRLSVAAIVRSTVMAGVRLASPVHGTAEPRLIGVSCSGRMDLAWCRRRFARLRPGRTYELMCHPGHPDPSAIAIPALRHYHDWAGELRTLRSREFADLLQQNRLRIASFADVGMKADPSPSGHAPT